jgi:hypothetical protein
MKKAFIITGILVCCYTILPAQDHRDQAPKNIQQSFHNDHPDMNDVNWQHINHQWHASHMDHQMQVDTYYDERGRKMDSHRRLDRKDVPQEVDRHLHDRYHANGNYEAMKIERPGHADLYRLKIKQRGRSRVFYTDNHGHEVKYYDHH